eukprot:Anaeramoba_ignava/a483285_11.p2 GENE.a483285_11~~a483285_11.p2  ORF type:complete len:125 (-),score=2.31 a483285_11:666-1040(-)
MGICLVLKKGDILFYLGDIKVSFYIPCNIFFQGLYTYLKLQRRRGELLYLFPQSFGKIIGDHLKVGHIGFIFFQEKIKQPVGNLDIQVKGPVYELEVSNSPFPKFFKLLKYLVYIEVPYLLVYG